MSTAIPAQTPSPAGLLGLLGAADRILAAALKWLTIALFTALLLILTANIVLRFLPAVARVVSLNWFDEIVELLYAALVFYGAAAVWMNHGHFSVGDWISKRIPSERGRRVYRLLLEMGCLAFAAIFFAYSLELTMKAQELTPVFGISKKVHYSCMPVSAAIMIVYSAKNALVELAGAVRGGPQT
jgi:TRAP-type C4-dicarboxylate transport system permease small subunit